MVALQLQTDLTGQPIVGVNQIMVVKARLQCGAELLCQGWQRLLGNVLGGSGLEMNHPGVLVDIDNVGCLGRVPPGEDIHLQAALAKPTRQFGDIHIETSGIAQARCGEWRRMHADHRDSMRIFPASVHFASR